MTTISYKLEKFEGPLDLLLSLISKNKIDISDIPIALVCEQYMDYLAQAEKFDIELSSDFIVMASELMLIGTNEARNGATGVSTAQYWKLLPSALSW